jgi:hypothetical protein
MPARLHPFMDKFCLLPVQPWDRGLGLGLARSRVVVAPLLLLLVLLILLDDKNVGSAIAKSAFRRMT